MTQALGYGGFTRDEASFVEGITPGDVMKAGAAFLMAVGNCAHLGHNSPNGMMDYVARPEDEIQALVWDAFAATKIGDDAHAASDRLYKFAAQRGLLDAVAAAMV